MQTLVNSSAGVFIIIIMIVVGYALAARHWFNEESTALIAKLVTQVALPPYMIISITKDFSHNQLVTLLPNLRFPVISMLLLFGISIIVARLIKVDASRRGLFESMFFNSNTVFVGLPINLALFGQRSLPFVLVYYMANTTIFWTLGVYLIQRDGTVQNGLSLKTILQKVFSEPLIGFIIGVILVLLDWHLPSFLTQSFTYLGNLTIPLSMLFIGISIYNAGLKNIRFGKDQLGVLAGRFIFAPLLMTALVYPSHMPTLMKQVFILQSCMPVMTNAPVVARLYNTDADFAAVLVTETTLGALLMVPLMMFLLGQLF